MSKELYNYDNINFNHKGLPKADNSNSEVDDDIISNNITSVSTETLFQTFNVPTMRNVDISDSNVTIDKDAVICKVCGRKLKDHHSRALGMGPMCYKQFKASRNKMFNLLIKREVNHG